MERLTNNTFKMGSYPIYDGYFLLLDPETNVPVVAPNSIWVNQGRAPSLPNLSVINKGILNFVENGSQTKTETGQVLAADESRELRYISTGGESAAFVFVDDSGQKEIVKIDAKRPLSKSGFVDHRGGIDQYPVFQDYIFRFRQIEIMREQLGNTLKDNFNIQFPRFNWIGKKVCSVEYVEGGTPALADLRWMEIGKLITKFIEKQAKKSPGLWQGLRPDIGMGNFIINNSDEIFWIDPLAKFR